MTTSTSAAKEFWESAIKEQTESGLSIGEYCRLIEKSTYQFYYWKRRVNGVEQRAMIPGGSDAQNFIELRSTGFVAYDRRDNTDQVDVRIGSFTISFTGNTNRELFKAAASALREVVG